MWTRGRRCGTFISGCVPQESIWGTLLYLIYVNDIGKSGIFDILSFADDTTLYMSHYDLYKLKVIHTLSPDCLMKKISKAKRIKRNLIF